MLGLVCNVSQWLAVFASDLNLDKLKELYGVKLSTLWGNIMFCLKTCMGEGAKVFV